ncbi:TetR/AcrR family transcriptional regulator [Nocardioides sp. KR10-350]|uniref:TetR/AcrR family transcriptional regulator n=1 Tax=Nocardioides cheoyonin TaxID=3156615 RepID=UPI0032B5406F
MARAYDMSTRAERARSTREQIIATATGLLLDGGYAGMTIATLAESARVSPQTVYNSIGGKPAVVKAVYDRMMAGDAESIAMSDRPEFTSMFTAPDRAGFVTAYAAWVGLLHSRVAPLIGALTAHGVDATLTDFLATIERERYTGVTHAMTGLRTRIGLPDRIATESGFTRLLDAVWALIAPDAYDRLVRRSGWSRDDYEEWLAGQLGVLLT